MNDDMLSPQPLSIEMARRDRFTATSSAIQRRPIVLVLGMHRSGTSLCSHILSALGVDMSDQIAGPGSASVTADNPRGHWERWEIVEFHDRILGLFNRDYMGHFHDFALPVAWWADPRVAEIRGEIVAFLKGRMGDGYFGFKDPRTVRLMPVWHQICNELKLEPKLVLCLRNPAQVARSLHARDKLDPEIGEYRWLVHMIDFFRYANSYDICTVEYEGWFADPSANLEKLRDFLDLPWQQSKTDLGVMLSGLIDPGARHDDPKHREATQPLVRSLYDLARRVGQDGEARDQIADIVSQFVGFQQLQRPFQQIFEHVAKTAAKFPEVEGEVAALRALVGERDTGLASAQLRADAAEARLANALAEIEGQRSQIAQLAERHDEREAMRAEIEGQRSQIAQLAERRDEREALQAEIAALWDTLVQSEAEMQQREAAATAMQGEVTMLRGSLARAAREAHHRATAALQPEIATLRGRLAQTEGEARESAATTAALQAEIETLQGTLTAARQVGKAAIAAFRIETAAPTKLVVPRGWRRAIMRFLGAATRF
jgi:predicted  nucleic acid-binding Zn-ribbon protein